MTTAELITLACAGDDRAFTALVEPLKRPVQTRLRRMLRDVDQADDLWQDTLVRVHRHLPGFDAQRSRFGTWVTTIAINLAINALRDRNRRRHIVTAADIDVDPELPGILEHVPDVRLTPDRLFRDRELGTRIEQAIANLTEDHRQAFVLREMQGHSYQAIAEATHASLGTVKSRLHRARTALAAALAEERVA